MRIFVVEYITGGGLLKEGLTTGLLTEAGTMVSALLEDLTDMPGVQVLVSRDPRLARPSVPCDIFTPRQGDDIWQEWRHCMQRCDAVWPIMPETGGLLERISRLALQLGCRLIGSRPEAVRLTASKLQTFRCLGRHGIDVVPTCSPASLFPDSAPRWVAKPDDGVGCEGIRILDKPDGLAACLGPGSCRDYVLQPYTKGTPASLSMLCHDGEACLLSANLQQVAELNGRFHVRGILVNGLKQSDRHAELARSIARAIPDLWGYVGVDLICTNNGPLVLEINPRLSVSYAGLHRALGLNPARLVLNLLSEGPSVLTDRRFGAGGSTTLNLESPHAL